MGVAVDWTKRLRLVRVSRLQTPPAWGPPDHTAVAVVIVIIIGIVVIIGTVIIIDIVVIIKTLVIITIVSVLSVIFRVMRSSSIGITIALGIVIVIIVGVIVRFFYCLAPKMSTKNQPSDLGHSKVDV